MKHAVALSALVALLASHAGAQSAEEGEVLFKKCKACHQIGEGAKNRSGPILTGVVGRQAGTVEGYKYSKDVVAAGEAGLVWTPENINGWLTDPKGFLRSTTGNAKAKTKMTLKIKSAEDRAALIAYLGTFSSAAIVPKDGFCVVNASGSPHLFATESREGTRQLAELAPGERLCANGTEAADGVVSVFESAEAVEGCSRIVPVGVEEKMFEYAEFDRCVWSAHRS